MNINCNKYEIENEMFDYLSDLLLVSDFPFLSKCKEKLVKKPNTKEVSENVRLSGRIVIFIERRE